MQNSHRKWWYDNKVIASWLFLFKSQSYGFILIGTYHYWAAMAIVTKLFKRSYLQWMLWRWCGGIANGDTFLVVALCYPSVANDSHQFIVLAIGPFAIGKNCNCKQLQFVHHNDRFVANVTTLQWLPILNAIPPGSDLPQCNRDQLEIHLYIFLNLSLSSQDVFHLSVPSLTDWFW